MTTNAQVHSRSRHPGKIDNKTEPAIPATLVLSFDAAAGVTKDGSNLVSSWEDERSNGELFTAGNAPLWVASAINGEPAIQFDGVNDYLSRAQAKQSTGTVVTLVKPQASTQTGLWSWANGLSSTSPWIIHQRQDAANTRFYVNADYRLTNVPNALNAAVLYTLTWDGFAWHVYLNASSTPAASYNGPAGTLAASTIFLGNGYAGYAACQIAIWRLYDRPLNDNERSAVQSSLVTRFGL